MDDDTFRKLGASRELKTILVGELTVSDIRPNISISPSLERASITAEVDATLAVEMIETATGASLRSATASQTQTVGHISVLGGGNISCDAPDPERAYGKLLNGLGPSSPGSARCPGSRNDPILLKGTDVRHDPPPQQRKGLTLPGFPIFLYREGSV